MKKIILILIALLPYHLRAAQYSYHPLSPMYLGGGFNPFNPTEAYLRCLNPAKTIPLETPNNRDLSIQISVVKSRHDLYSKTDMSASVSGSYGPFSGGGSVTKMDEITFNENDFHWIIVLKSDMGKYGLENPQLTDEVKNMSSDQILNRCGSEIVTQERRGVMLYALVTVHNLSQSERHEMETKIGGGINTGIYSVAVSGKYKSILQFSYAVGTVSIALEAQGGSGIKDLADIIGGGENNFANYSKLPDIVNAYVKGFNPDNAVPLQYFSTSLTAFKTGVTLRSSDFQATQVGLIYEKYLDINKTISRIDTLLSPNNNTGIEISQHQRQELSDVRDIYEKYRDDLYDAGRKCFNEKLNSCKTPKTREPVITWPKLNPNKLCKIKRDDVLLKGLYPQAYYNLAESRNLVPILGSTATGIEIVGYYPCEEEY